jgi:hypothetical protein
MATIQDTQLYGDFYSVVMQSGVVAGQSVMRACFVRVVHGREDIITKTQLS